MKLETSRLVLREWRDSDIEPLAQINADSQVMRWFPSVLSYSDSEKALAAMIERSRKNGFCFQPVEVKVTGEFIGFVGLNRPEYSTPLPCGPCVEIGWRLKRRAWGKGYASEAAREWLRFGFETLFLTEIVSFTATQNGNSQALMSRIGMRRDFSADFNHPMLPSTHALAAHVLYRISYQSFISSSR